MFCPKCGQQNPETGKFCRSCGTDLGNVSDALSGKLPLPMDKSCALNSKGKPITYESAATKFFMGVAFVAIAIALAVTGAGRGWWFWMLVPALMFVGGGIAQYIQIKKFEQGGVNFSPESSSVLASTPANAALPPSQTNFVAPESRYKTGDLVPPSVTESTTRHLELDQEGQTMPLKKS